MKEHNYHTQISRSKNDVRKFYDDYAKDWDARFHSSKSTHHFLSKRLIILQEMCGFNRDDLVLEVGCGTGFHLLKSSPMFRNGVGVDFSELMISCAQEKSKVLKNKNVIFRIDNAEELSTCTDNSFDLVFFVALLEHLLDPTLFLKQTCRVLKPSGRLIGITPNGLSPWYSIIGKLFRKSTKHLSSDRFYTVPEISELLKKSGFQLNEFRIGGFSPAGIPDYLYHLFFIVETLLEKTSLRNWGGSIYFSASKPAMNFKM